MLNINGYRRVIVADIESPEAKVFNVIVILARKKGSIPPFGGLRRRFTLQLVNLDLPDEGASHLNVFLKPLKNTVEAGLLCTLCNALLQLLKLNFLTHLISELYVLALGVESEATPHAFFRSPFKDGVLG